MNAHTPGPWFAVNCGTADEPMYSVKAARIKGKKPGHEVCICATGDSPQEMETANAILIAAAPDLLAALKSLLTSHVEDQWDARAIKAAYDAIAKADGG